MFTNRSRKCPAVQGGVRLSIACSGILKHVVPLAAERFQALRIGKLRVLLDEVLNDFALEVLLEAVTPLAKRPRVICYANGGQ